MELLVHNELLDVWCGDVLKPLPLPDNSVHCIVTSPPYWNLRDYNVAGQLGLESTPGEYIDKIVLVFRELHRVLRPDGTLWLNMGDSYCGSRSGPDPNEKSTLLGSRHNQEQSRVARMTQSRRRDKHEIPRSDVRVNGLKSKDLCGMPWRVAFALQADGWYLRCDIIWSKPNPMPESVYDRPTKSHEYLFLLSKRRKYFYDIEAIKEAASPNTHSRLRQPNLMKQKGGFKQEEFPGARMPGKKGRDRRPQQILQSMAIKAGINPKAQNFPTGWASGTGRRHDEIKGRYPRSKQNESFSGAISPAIVSRRNRRSVWNIVTRAYKGAHFATFPPKLVEPCILAGTSAKGCCPACGAPWKRVITKGVPDDAWRKASGSDVNGEYHGQATKDYEAAKAENASAVKARILKGMVHRTTSGWIPTCKCFGHFMARSETNPDGTIHKWREYVPDGPQPDPVPCTVLDPFGGSGTTAEVAIAHGRRAILFELNPEYIDLIRKRVLEPNPLFAHARM